MLTAASIHFCIRKHPILKQADVQLAPGSFAAILGPNGAGKSTLLKILSGELPCSHGEVRLNQQAIQKYTPGQLAEMRAVMPQFTQLSFPFKAAEVVALGCDDSRCRNPQKVMEEVMQATATEHLAFRYFADLSGGEKQRIQLARVLAQIWEPKPFPRYLLLDEATSSLDLAQQHLVMQAVSTLKTRNIGILAIIHDINLALAYADHLLLMKQGEITQQGYTEELLREDIFTQVYDHPVQIIKDKKTGKSFIISAPLLEPIQIKTA